MQRKYAAAEPLLRECLAIRAANQPDAWLTFRARSQLGGSLLGQKKYAEAEPLVLTGYEGMQAQEAWIPDLNKNWLIEAGADRRALRRLGQAGRGGGLAGQAPSPAGRAAGRRLRPLIDSLAVRPTTNF